MDGWNLYYVPIERDHQTGETFELECVYMYLSYRSYNDALKAKTTLETVYHPDGGRIEISHAAVPNTYQPGEVA